MVKTISPLFLVLVWLVKLQASTYYLDAVGGNDNWLGTSTNPWKTLNQSRLVAVSGDTVLLKNGNYGAYIEDLNSMNRSNWIWYMADNGQTAVIIDRINVVGKDVNAFLHFEGIDVFYPAQSPCPSSGGAITIANFAGVNYITFKNCKIHAVNTYDSGGGIQFNHVLNPIIPVHDLLVENCEIFQTTTGIRFSGTKTAIINNHIHHIHGTMIGNLCGPMSATDLNAATNVLIENNHLHDMHFYTDEPCFSTPGWSTSHASLIGIRGHHWTVRGNHMHDTWSPVIQLYGDDCGGVYGRGDILFENNIIYDNESYKLFYNPGNSAIAYIGNPIVFRHNTILSGRQDSMWTTADFPKNRFKAGGSVQSIGLNLLPSPPNPYDGTGTIFEDNIFLLETGLGNFNYQDFNDTTAKWIARNNLIYVRLWNSGTLDPSNFLVSDKITANAIAADFIDHQLFLSPNYNKNHKLTYTPGSTFDLIPKEGSIICNMSSTGGYIGALPCATAVTTSEKENKSNFLSVFPNPTNGEITINGMDTFENDILSISLLNGIGETVYKSTYINGSATFSVHLKQLNLPSGVYFINIQGINQYANRQFVYSSQQ